MIIKFKNGYQVQVTDAAGKSRREIIDIARKAAKKVRDAELEKTITTNVSFMPTKIKVAISKNDMDMLKQEYKYFMRDLEADASESHKNYPSIYRREVLEKIIRQYEDAQRLFMNAGELAVIAGVDADKIRELIDQIRKNWDMEREKSYHARITYENGEVTDKDFSNKDAARADIMKRVYIGEKDGNPVETAVIVNNEDDTEVENVYPFEDAKIHDAEEVKEVVGYIDYVDSGAKEKHFTDIDEARAEVKELLNRAEKLGEKVRFAGLLDGEGKNVIEEIYRSEEVKDSKKVRDIPYFDPTDYPTIKSEYSVDRLAKEIRHPEKSAQNLEELDKVMKEIDEFIIRGSEALIEAGWSKDDARRAINSRYIELEKELRRNKMLDEARALHKKIRELEKAWDLRI